MPRPATERRKYLHLKYLRRARKEPNPLPSLLPSARRAQPWRRLILPLALASLGVLAPGCRNAASEKLAQQALRPESQSSRPSLDKVRGATFQNWEITGRDSQRRPAWRLKSRETRIGVGQNSSSPARATLLGARAELFRDGVLESSFQAERIEFVTMTVPASGASPHSRTRQVQRLEFSGGVRAQAVPPPSLLKGKPKSQGSAQALVASAPVLLEAPSAVVNLSDKTVWVPQSARVRQPKSGVSVSARTLRGDIGLKRLDLGGGVEASSPQGRVRADRAAYNWKSNRLLALGHVRAQAPLALGGKAPTNLLLSGERLEADAAGGGGLLSGGVRAQAQGGQSGAASASQIRFRWSERAIQAQGGVSVEKDGSTIKAAQVSTDSGFSQVTASGGVAFRSRDGALISADRVRAFDKFTRAVASGGVRLMASTSSGQVSLSAAQVEAFDNFSRAVASGGVVLRQGAATVRASNVQAFDLKGSGRAIARGGVEVVRDDLTVNANSVQAANLRDKNLFVVAASGGVRARNAQGLVSCQSVRWAAGRVEASGSVALRGKGSVLWGDRLSSDDKFENALLTGHVRGELPQGGSVNAGRIEKAGPKIIATGGVQARQAGVSLRMARLEATASGSDVLGSGGVVLTTSDGATLRAPSARYSKARDEAYAEDGAHYTDPRHGLSLNGRRVLVRHVSDDKRREASIDGASGRGSLKAIENLRL